MGTPSQYGSGYNIQLIFKDNFDSNCNEKIDIYSFGSLLWTLLYQNPLLISLQMF